MEGLTDIPSFPTRCGLPTLAGDRNLSQWIEEGAETLSPRPDVSVTLVVTVGR